MSNSVMYLAQEAFAATSMPSGRALLVGVIAMKPGFDYEDHSAYEKALAPITAKHGMRLFRAYRVVQPLGGGPANAVAINIWEPPSPEALGKVMEILNMPRSSPTATGSTTWREPPCISPHREERTDESDQVGFHRVLPDDRHGDHWFRRVASSTIPGTGSPGPAPC